MSQYTSILIEDIRKGDRIRSESSEGSYLPDSSGLKVTATEWVAEKDYADGMAMEGVKFYLIERPRQMVVSEADVKTFRRWFRSDHTLTPDQDSAIAIFLDSIRKPSE